ncbi:Gfo/Idh/MocA family oxidoreductase [Mucilaginibacter ginsenosidivorax]|uniref:Gfo/Idh/MocA-like oxidoreductase N-terminal domain-containing protein n=1 Tax=Mucilaginibacter ginsenosidivorax TaxID=862126 RepID=A0A5B8W2J8_9SPHI|nr:Gfo/Idh/MocA family oxidoreductase [Mucilaginibacter ginsenosidivorax]QEC78074.1 hypothetical protein FSB76_19835 [Mucilaginibacter ginsenosidivorax]
MNNVIIIGTGNIGKRHLQALYRSDLEFEIVVYDVFKESLSSVSQFCIDNKLDSARVTPVESFDKLLGFINGDSVVIVATTATDRINTLEPVIIRKPKAIIVEKPIVQVEADYYYIQSIAESNQVPVYVNFIAHAQHFYREIYQNVKDAKEFSFYTNMPNWGMSTVGVHQFELFFWLFGIKEYEVVFSEVSSVYEQKRKGFYDLAGSIVLSDKKGNIAVFRNHTVPSFPSIQIITEDYLYTVHESQNMLIKIGPDKKPVVTDLNVRFVSTYINEIVDYVFNNEFDKVYLPTIADSFLAHKLLFDYISQHVKTPLNIT